MADSDPGNPGPRPAERRYARPRPSVCIWIFESRTTVVTRELNRMWWPRSVVSINNTCGWKVKTDARHPDLHHRSGTRPPACSVLDRQAGHS